MKFEAWELKVQKINADFIWKNMQQIIEVYVIYLKRLPINKTCLEHVVGLPINVKHKAPTRMKYSSIWSHT